MSKIIFIKQFPLEYTEKELKDTFRGFGRIQKVKMINWEPDNRRTFYSRHYAMIKFYKENSVEKAIKAFNFKEYHGGKWLVSHYDRQWMLNVEHRGAKYNEFNIFVTNFPENWDENRLIDIFSQYGTIKSSRFDGNKAFVQYKNLWNFNAAIRAELFKEYDGKKLYVTKYFNKDKLIKTMIERKRKKLDRRKLKSEREARNESEERGKIKEREEIKEKEEIKEIEVEEEKENLVNDESEDSVVNEGITNLNIEDD